MDLPVYYMDKKSSIEFEQDRLDAIQQRSSYSEKFLEAITTKLEIEDFKQKYRIVNLAVELQINADSGFLKEPSKDEPFYRQFFCQDMENYILNLESSIVVLAAIGPEGSNHSILFIEYSVVNLIFKLFIYR